MILAVRRSAMALAAFTCSLALGACSRGIYVPPAGSGPTPTPSASAAVQVNYTAIGASDAYGYGASVPCGTTGVAVPTCPGGTGYVPDLANLLTHAGDTVALNDLGISGAVLAPDIRALGNMYGSAGSADACMARGASDAIPGDFVTDELPKLTGTETLVTVFAGGNDTNVIVNALGCGAGGTTAASQQAFVTTWITNFGNDIVSSLTTLKSKAPNAKIAVANLPNFALIPVGQAQSATVQAALAAVSVGIDLNVLDKATSLGIPVVDLLCDARSYDPANFYTDGFHPDDAGYAIFAQAFYAQITAATPTPPNLSCSYAAQSARLRTPLLTPVPRFEGRR